MAEQSEQIETAPAVDNQEMDLVRTETAVAAPTEKKMVKKVIRRKKRPARVQIDPDELQNQEPPPQTGTTYNIWYNKWSGGGTFQSIHTNLSWIRQTDPPSQIEKTSTSPRDTPEDDAISLPTAATPGPMRSTAATSASSLPGASAPRVKTATTSTACQALSISSTPASTASAGIGSPRSGTTWAAWEVSCDRTGLSTSAAYTSRTTLRRLWRGTLLNGVRLSAVSLDVHASRGRQSIFFLLTRELVRVLNSRGVGFITYTNEANASFAREAMMHQCK